MMLPSRRPAAILAAASVAGLYGCGGGEGADLAPPATFQDVAFDTLFEVGAAEGEAWQVFGGIWDVEAAPDGHFAVLDLEAPAVHVYDERGAHVGSVEAAGLDEGALDRPNGLAWGGTGNLLVWDPGSSWISRFSVDDRGGSVDFVDRARAFAFGETGFCAAGERIYLSYWQDGSVVHEIGAEGTVRSFGAAPAVAGIETLGPELQEIAIEELTPSGLLCTPSGVLDVSFMQSTIRLHDLDGRELWSHPLADFTPIVVYTPDGMGLGRAFDENDGSHLLRSVVAWGDDMALVQHELRTREVPEEGEVEVFESRLVRLSDGAELDRTRDLPLILAAQGSRFYMVQKAPFPKVVVVELAQ
ncbi:MAG: hypothetical protein FJ207_14100 [Gemmatimonadetes bacterium]|nr:hypothetical protein [Gemmatimonadota bacterium]